MSKARTVPGESISSRLSARSDTRARIGPQRSFYQRLGVTDPYGDEPEVEEIARSGMYSFLSAANYYRELRSQRLRMMWRLGAIRHRSVAGERLRAAGPAFASPRTLAGASLPNLSDLVLIDPEARHEVDEEIARPTGRRSESPRRARKAATRAVERSADRPDAELARALAQIESLVRGRSRDAVQAVQRDLPSMDAARRPEVIRELVRTVEREVVRETPTVRPAAIERMAERAQPSSVRAARVDAQRPLAVAAQRGRSVDAPMVGRSTVDPLFDGPSGLEPVLRGSPAVRAAIAVERAGRRPEAIERLAGAAFARGSRGEVASGSRALPVVSRVELAPAERTAPAAAVEARLVRPRQGGAERRATRRSERYDERSVADLPTARLARVAASQPLAARIAPELVEGSRGPHAPAIDGPAARGAVTHALMRERVGRVSEGEPAPLSTAATSWLSESVHPERARQRAFRAIPAARSLAVAGELSLLQPSVESEPASEATGRVAVPGARTGRAARASAGREGDLPAVTRAVVRPEARGSRSTLRAVTRAQQDETRLAPSPVVGRRVDRALPASAPVLLAPQDVASPSESIARRSDAPAPRGGAVVRAARSAGEDRPAIRVARRIERSQPELAAVAPILGRIPMDEGAAVPSRRSVGSAIRPVALDLLSVSQASAGEEAPSSMARRRPMAPRTAAQVRRRADRPDVALDGVPATRRAMHRAVAAGDMAPARRPLTASPTTFVDPVRSQRALAVEDGEGAVPPTPRAERALTRAASRDVRTARVDTQDRVRLVPSVTDYLDVAAGAEDLLVAPVRGTRPARLLAPEARLVATETAQGSEPAPRRRVPTARAAERAAPRRRAIDLTETRDVAVRPAGLHPQIPTGDLMGLVRRLAATEQTTTIAPATRIAERSEAPPDAGPREVRWTEGTSAPRSARVPRSVVAMQDLTLPHLSAPGVESAPERLTTRRRDLPPLAESLRQVAGSFRAAERDDVQVVSIGAARRASESAGSRGPTLEAILERDEDGRIVQARGRRLIGATAGETVTLDPGSFGVPAVAAERAEGRAARGAQRVAATDVASAGRARSALAASAAPSVLARKPAEWAEERAAAAAPESDATRAPGVSSPVRRAGKRWTRPIPEGPVLEVARPDQAEAPHRLTAPMARGIEEPEAVRGGRRVRGPRPAPAEMAFVDAPVAAAESAEGPRRRSHGVNTWTDVPSGPGEAGSPSWVRRAVEPSRADRPDREAPGSRVRAGGGLMTALSRAEDPEEIVRVILQRSHQAGALARELPGEAGQILQTIASTQASALDEPTVVPSRGNRGETVPSQASRRARTAWLESGAEGSRTWRTRGGSASSSEASEGVGASSIMKLASKLKKLIHLAENARRDEARSAVRMSDDTGEARQDVGAGKAGGQALEEDNMHIERLREDVLREVQHMLEMNKMRSIGDGDGQW